LQDDFCLFVAAQQQADLCPGSIICALGVPRHLGPPPRRHQGAERAQRRGRGRERRDGDGGAVVGAAPQHRPGVRLPDRPGGGASRCAESESWCRAMGWLFAGVFCITGGGRQTACSFAYSNRQQPYPTKPDPTPHNPSQSASQAASTAPPLWAPTSHLSTAACCPARTVRSSRPSTPSCWSCATGARWPMLCCGSARSIPLWRTGRLGSTCLRCLRCGIGFLVCGEGGGGGRSGHQGWERLECLVRGKYALAQPTALVPLHNKKRRC